MPCLDILHNLTAESIMVNQFRAYFTPLFAVFGIIGNILVITTFVHMERRQTSRFNLYLIFISAAQTTDLLVNAFLDDFMGRGLTWASDCTVQIKLDTYTLFGCKLFSYAPKVTSFVSNNLLVISTVDRLLTTYEPIRFRGNSHIRTIKVLISMVILLGVTIFIPQLMYADLVFEDKSSLIGKISCQYQDSLLGGVQFVLYASIIGTYIVPTICITMNNIFIVFKLRALTNSRYRLGVTTRQTPNEMHRIVGHLCLTTVFLFFTFPLTVVIILRQRADFGNYRKLHPEYAQKLVDLSRLFSSFDAIIYFTQFPILYTFLPNFRRTLCQHVCCTGRYFHATGNMNTPPDTTLRSRRESERPGPPIMPDFLKIMATGNSLQMTNIRSQ